MSSNFDLNTYYTTDLVLNVMAHCARAVDQDIQDDTVADTMYDICCDLEDFPADEGFGSSDHYSYVNQAKSAYDMTPHNEYATAMQTVARYLAETITEEDPFNDTERTHKEIDRLATFFRKDR